MFTIILIDIVNFIQSRFFLFRKINYYVNQNDLLQENDEYAKKKV